MLGIRTAEIRGKIGVNQSWGGMGTLVIGMGVATYVAVLATLGFFARRFLSQQTANHADTLRALALLEHLDGQVPRNAKRRMRDLERITHRHRWRRETRPSPPS